MSDDIGLGLSSMADCFDFHSINVVQLSNRNAYFYQFWCHHPLITQLRVDNIDKNLTVQVVYNYAHNIRSASPIV